MIPDAGPLVDARWLSAHLDRVVVADCRWYLDGRSGHDAFVAGHIPGAVWLDVDADLAAPSSPEGGRHPLPAPAAFAAAMGRAGIGDDSVVIAYDDAGGSIAARLWWMLRSIGRRAAVLDGGLASWTGPLRQGPVAPRAVRFTERPWPAADYAVTAEVHPARRTPGTLLLDARVGARYRGEDTGVDPRPGHIPGARSAPWPDNVDSASGRLLPAARLRERFTALGAAGAERVIVSCGSGVTACHDLLALTVAGIDGAALYTGSWSAWSSDPARPVELGDPYASSPRCSTRASEPG